MFCPKCGAEGGTTRFCRSCGTNLAVVSNVLSEDDPSRPRPVALGNRTTLNLFHTTTANSSFSLVAMLFLLALNLGPESDRPGVDWSGLISL